MHTISIVSSIQALQDFGIQDTGSPVSSGFSTMDTTDKTFGKKKVLTQRAETGFQPRMEETDHLTAKLCDYNNLMQGNVYG
jgi:hypothetical protein